MKYILIFNKKRFLQVLVLSVALIFVAGIIYSEHNNISVFKSTITPKAIYNVPTDKKQLALTFDLSWGENNIERILEVLDKYSLKGKATFFLSSKWAEKKKEFVKHIFDNGYEIGNHGHSNVNYSTLSNEEITTQILKAHKILKNITGQEPKFIRTPNGNFDERILDISHNLGYTVIHWDTDSKDQLNPGINQIANHVLENTHPGDIILMHANDSSNQIVYALPLIISRLKKDGYDFSTITQLLLNSKVNLHEIN